MKLRKVALTNVGCFLDRQEIVLDGEMTILIGPNGGGKTTLIDTAVNVLRKYFVVGKFAPESGNADAPEFGTWGVSDLHNYFPNKHRGAEDLPQVIEIELQVTDSDVENIRAIKAYVPEMAKRSPQQLAMHPIGAVEHWDLDEIVSGVFFRYEIRDHQLQPLAKGAELFISYLNAYDVHREIRRAYRFPPLAIPIAYMPAVRNQGISTRANLGQSGFWDVRRASQHSSARNGNPGLMELAIQVLAERGMSLIMQGGLTSLSKLKHEAGPSLLTDILARFGYSWDFVCTNPRQHLWDMSFKKAGKPFVVGDASTGEKEIIYYAVSITLLDIRDTLVVVDEPELHLHPKSQRQLLSLFQYLGTKTSNQFVFATHSPIFVTPESISHVSRIAAVGERHVITQIDPKGIPDGKRAFDLINALNNEKIFFAEKVILVEGPSDAVFFGALFDALDLLRGKDIEIVQVGGKGNFPIYKALLEACRLPYAIVADQDFLKQIGSEDVKALLAMNAKAIKECLDEEMVGNKDGKSLADAIQLALESADIKKLTPVWAYIAARRAAFSKPISEDDQKKIDANIGALRRQSIFVLRRGALESYLPKGFLDKDLDKIIGLVKKPNFPADLDRDSLEELKQIGLEAVM